jgi:protein involved in polysaccharide export with SLBB domain
LSAAVALLSACAATGIEPVEALNDTGKELIAEPPAESRPQMYRFHPGDELSIRAVNRPEITLASVRVDPYGNISFPYLGEVNVRNMSANEVAERLARGLQEGGYYTRAHFSVSLLASKEQYVYVLGEVKTPGPITNTGSIPLLAAIGRAGGQTYNAEMSTVLWIRGSQSPPGVVKLDLQALGDPRATQSRIPNLALSPGDVIYIPDSVIASVERFMNRMYNIIRPVVLLEQGIVLYPSVESALSGEGGERSSTINIIVP